MFDADEVPNGKILFHFCAHAVSACAASFLEAAVIVALTVRKHLLLSSTQFHENGSCVILFDNQSQIIRI